MTIQVSETRSKYGTSSSDYLSRAMRHANEGSFSSLFYAALELRCFVEKRQNEYLESQEVYRKSLPRSWKIGSQAKELEKIYRKSETQIMDWVFEDGFEVRFRYVPVALDLRKGAEQLGQLLHAQEHDRMEDWFEREWKRLLELIGVAEKCCEGNLFCPALIDPSDEKPVGQVSGILDRETSAQLKARFEQQANMTVRINYV